MPSDSLFLGQTAEEFAADYLIARGFKYVNKNYRCKAGEIDLIMRDDEFLVFVEVRLRFDPHYGSSLETITRRKQQRIIHAAKHYLITNNLYEKEYCRFDAVGIDGDWQVSWVKNAFY